MKKTLTILSVVLLAAGGLFAQSTKDLTMTVNLSAWYDLSLSATSISFTDVAPTAAAAPAAVSIAANEGAVSVRAFAVTGAGKTLNLTVKANGDLTSGSNTIGSDVDIRQYHGRLVVGFHPSLARGLLHLLLPPQLHDPGPGRLHRVRHVHAVGGLTGFTKIDKGHDPRAGRIPPPSFFARHGTIAWAPFFK